MLENELILKVKSLKENEAFVRLAVSSFCALSNPTLEELGDIKTAVSEAFTNCVVHAYPKDKGDVEICVKFDCFGIYISITDFGVGIEDINKAKQPFYTSKPNTERSGMGFTVMEGFMDSLNVVSVFGKGVKVEMTKKRCCDVAVGG